MSNTGAEVAMAMTERYVTGFNRGGGAWIPQFVQGIDRDRCIGCGRCFKVCGRDVFELVSHTDLEDTEKMVMTVAQGENCIGCQACARVCPKGCHQHAPALASA